VLKIGRPGFDSLAKSGLNTLKVGIHSMDISSRGKEGPRLPWIFIHGSDKIERGLMVLFFGIVFPVGHPGSFSPDALDSQLPCTLDVQHKKGIV